MINPWNSFVKLTKSALDLPRQPWWRPLPADTRGKRSSFYEKTKMWKHKSKYDPFNFHIFENLTKENWFFAMKTWNEVWIWQSLVMLFNQVNCLQKGEISCQSATFFVREIFPKQKNMTHLYKWLVEFFERIKIVEQFPTENFQYLYTETQNNKHFEQNIIREWESLIWAFV